MLDGQIAYRLQRLCTPSFWPCQYDLDTTDLVAFCLLSLDPGQMQPGKLALGWRTEDKEEGAK